MEGSLFTNGNKPMFVCLCKQLHKYRLLCVICIQELKYMLVFGIQPALHRRHNCHNLFLSANHSVLILKVAEKGTFVW